MISSTDLSENLGYQIFKKYVNQNEGMHPRTFCRRWFGLEYLEEDGRMRFTESQILAMESEHGYREQCVNLLAKILRIKPNTVQRWGKGVEFDKIPLDKRHQYQVYLGYVDVLRVLTVSLAKDNEDLILRLLNHSNKSLDPHHSRNSRKHHILETA